LAINLDQVAVNVILNVIVPTIILSPILWLSGRLSVGKEKARFSDAIWIVFIGTILGSIFSYALTGIIASIIQLIAWLGLVKHFFDCGWLKALAISILAVLIFIAVAVLLALLGFGIWLFTSGVWSDLF
jgi:hypothetical protein